MRRSGEMSMKPLRMAVSTPPRLRVSSSSTAPKTMNSKVMAVMMPCTVAAAMTVPCAPHNQQRQNDRDQIGSTHRERCRTRHDDHQDKNDKNGKASSRERIYVK